jgi:hypothetical protein
MKSPSGIEPMEKFPDSYKSIGASNFLGENITNWNRLLRREYCIGDILVKNRPCCLVSPKCVFVKISSIIYSGYVNKCFIEMETWNWHVQYMWIRCKICEDSSIFDHNFFCLREKRIFQLWSYMAKISTLRVVQIALIANLFLDSAFFPS